MDPETILKWIRQCGYFCELENCSKNKDSSDSVVLRININDNHEADTFLHLFETNTFTQLIRSSELTDPKRVLYHKYYVCQHSSTNKKRSLSKTEYNTECTAKLDILIKKCTPATKRNDKFLKLKPPLCGKIKVDLVHNHTIGTSGSLKHLKISKETKSKFEEYFNNGMSPAEACRYHESQLLLFDKSWEMLANSSINPTKNVVYYLHKLWTQRNYGNVFEPISKLQEKLTFYESLGMYVALATDPWAVLVVTPIMKRAQKLTSSSEIIFCDSTSSCDITETTVTILLTVTKAGAVPIAVLLHDGQSTVSYEQAYGLLKRSFPYCFGGQLEPLCFMTDDSRAEKTALSNIYSNTKQLLCFFHVLQKEWRWLCEKKNNIPLERRQFLMNLFRKVMYADSEENLNDTITQLKKSAQDFPSFLQRFEAFYMRSEEWVYLHRKTILIRGSNTNNYAEVSIRVLKDIILHRTKGYNCVALVDFIIFVWEEYFKAKLLDYAHGRRNEVKNNFLKLCSKMDNLDPKDVCDLGNGLYQVPSSETKCLQYVIDIPAGVCSCPVGINGAFCKHQAYIYKTYSICFINAPAVSYKERALLGELALGTECPSINWFMDLSESKCSSSSNNSGMPSVSTSVVKTNMDAINTNSSEGCDMVTDEELAKRKSLISEISSEFQRLSELATEVPSTVLEKLKRKLVAIVSPGQLFSAITAAKRTIKKRGKIKVQPTAISRRRPGVTRGSTRIPSGRPPVGIKKRDKRGHNISSNINLNKPNAILHGRCHYSEYANVMLMLINVHCY